MSSLPDCYGSISLGDNSPCFQCGLRALCASKRTRDSKFGILLWPRTKHAGLHAMGDAALQAMSLKDDTIVKELREAFTRLGLRGSRKVFQYGSVSLLKVTEANFTKIVLEFPTMSLEEFSNAPSSAKAVKVLPLDTRTKKTQLTSSSAIKEFRDNAPGCVATFTDVKDAVTLVSELLRTLKDKLGSNE